MKEMIVLSGKGGAGKTSFTAAFARLAENKAVLVDADVDAADLALLLKTRLISTNIFHGLPVPVIDYAKCTRCGKCVDWCRFNAISPDIKIDPLACEGCQVCYNFCPENAISLREEQMGEWFISETPEAPLVHARLEPGGENSGKLVSVVRKAANSLAREMNREYIITDGPPGIGCPVISCLTGAHLACVVTEATSSGIHDMGRIMKLLEFFKIPAAVIINKYDLNLSACSTLERDLQEKGIPVIGKFPYDEIFYQAVSQGKSLPEMEEISPYMADSLNKCWESLVKLINEK